MYKLSQLIKNLKNGFQALSKKERIVVYVLTIVLCISFISIISKLNAKFLVATPEEGGTISEGIIGTPTLINPVLSVTDADKDMVALVYSGLMRKTSEGDFIPDLAESYTISPDGTIYTFVLKDNLTFHNGDKLTASDVVFTINKIQDPLIKSPRSIQWESVLVEEKDPKTIVFALKQPNVSFINNTTVGIIPASIWKNISPTEFSLSNLNIKGTGSGPYMIKTINYNGDGIPNEYILTRFKNFALGKPYIKKISIKSYSNEKDLIQNLKNGNIDQAGGISPFNAETVKPSTAKISTSILPRTFGIFFNQSNNKILADSSVRNAIDLSVDRQNIIDQVLKGYGTVIDNPIPKEINSTSIENFEDNKSKAIELLEKSGWKLGEDGIRQKGTTTKVTTGTGKNKKTTEVTKGPFTRLSFTLTTSGDTELLETAEFIRQNMSDIGIEVVIKIYETGSLNQIIRARDYEALLFGQVINGGSDMFAFWHSSQKADPGLNISLYNNTKADSLLEQIQKIASKEERLLKYKELNSLFKSDIPAVFIYSPDYIYAISKKLNFGQPLNITIPSDRFNQVYLWYVENDMVWKIFAK